MYVEQAFRLSDAQLAALVAISRLIDLAPGPGGARITPLGAKLEACRAALDSFGGAWVQGQAIALQPSAQLVAHCDAPIRGTRYHLPLAVNPGCWVFHAGTWQQLTIGRCYQMDPTQLHGAVNWGSTIRTHLMIDMEAHADL